MGAVPGVKLRKSPPELEQTFEAAFPADPRAQRKKMFGFSAGFVNGNMFGGLFEDQVVLRLSPADRQTLSDEHGAEPFMPMGRPMTGYLLVPASVLSEPDRLRDWVARAFAFAAALPAKAPKPRAATAPKPKSPRAQR
jgi:TfoX/Sxy family transcriptional regulator of competence genes